MDCAPECLNCGGLFSLKRGSKRDRSPCLLNCGHVFCCFCLKKDLLAQQEGITCFSCKEITKLKQPGSLKCLERDLFSLGLCVDYEDSKLLHAFDSNNWRTSSETAGQSAPSPKKATCRECQQRTASCFCKQCEVPMCSNCFTKIHSSSNVLSKHQASALDGLEDGFDISKYTCDKKKTCATHDQPIEFYCENDGFLLCSKCVATMMHADHDILTLEDKFGKSLSTITNLDHQVKVNLCAAKQTSENVSKLVKNVDEDKKKILQKVQNSFKYYHSLLQCKEKELRDEVIRHFEKKSSILNEKALEINGQIEATESKLKGIHKIMSKGLKGCLNMQKIIEELKDLVEVPCFADFKDGNDNDTRSCSIKKALTLIEAISQLAVHMSGVDVHEEEIHLKKIQDVPELVEAFESQLPPDHIDRSYLDNLVVSPEDSPKVLNTSIDESDYMDASSSSIHEDEQNVIKRRNSSKPSSGSSLKAYVSHIINPCDFYLQTVYDALRLKTINNEINVCCNSIVNSSNYKVSRLSEFFEGEIVFGHFKEDDIWYRARIVKLQEDKADLFYIDYGNSESVGPERILRADSKYKKTAGLSMHCSLADIIPSRGADKWCSEAVQSFTRMATKKPMQLIILKTREDLPTLVDLCWPSCEDISSTGYVSVRDSLVFLGHAVFISTSTSSKTHKVNSSNSFSKNQKNYCELVRPRVKSYLKVMITHVESPEKIYMQEITENTNSFLETIKNMNIMYTEDVNDLYTFVNPSVGDLCAAKYSEDSVWYRAKILEIIKPGHVKVKYVDYGNEEVLSVWNIKKIRNAYLNAPVQALECKLADISPILGSTENPLGTSWPPEATKFLEGLKNNTSIIIFVKEHLANKMISVYMKKEEDDQTINELMAQNGWANSELPRGVQIISSFADNRLLPHISLDQISGILSGEKTYDLKSRSFKMEYGKKLDVETRLVITPGEFYLQLPVQKVILARLSEDISMEINKNSKTAAICSSISNGVDKDPANKNKIDKLLQDQVQTLPVTSPLVLPTTSPVTSPLVLPTTSSVASPPTSPVASPTASPPTSPVASPTASPLASPVKSPIASPVVSAVKSPIASPAGISIDDSSLLCLDSWTCVDSWLCGDHCLAWNANESCWCRAVIKSVKCVEEVVTVHFYDYGSVNDIPISKLRPLPDDLRSAPLVIRCHLDGIIPAGDITKWSSVATESFLSLAASCNNCFEAVFLSCPVDESTAVELFLKETLVNDEKEETQPQLSVSQYLKDNGLALPKLQKKEHPSREKSNPSKSTLVETMDDIRRSALHLYNFSAADEEIDYPPFVPPTSKQFVFCFTHISPDGVIYGQEWKPDLSEMESMMSMMDRKYKNMPPENERIWVVGELVCCKFFEDDHFYRAKIISIELDLKIAEVLFVDYGNKETVSFEDLRPPMFTDVPVLCYPCELYQVSWIKDGDKIPEMTIHSVKYFIEKSPTITADVKEFAEHPSRLIVEFYLNGHVPLSESLFQWGLIILPLPGNVNFVNQVPCSIKKQVDPKRSDLWEKLKQHCEEDFDNGVLTYSKMPLPNIGEVVFCQVTYVHSPMEIYIQRIPVKIGQEKSEQKCNERITLLHQMTKYYQENWSSCKMLTRNDLKKGRACLAKCPQDGKWHRGEVRNYWMIQNTQTLQIFFVDYGHVSNISDLESIRELPEEHLDLPRMAYKCQLSSLTCINTNIPKATIVEQLDMVFLKKHIAAVVKNIHENGILEVDMYEKKSFLMYGPHKTPLIYQHLLPSGFFLPPPSRFSYVN